MFKIDIHALWSYDFMGSLARVLTEFLDMHPEEAKQMVSDLKEGTPQVMFLESFSTTTLLTQELLQLGMYISVTQVKQLSEAQFVMEITELMGEDLGGWLVLLDEKEEHVVKIIDAKGLMMLAFETQGIMDAIGEEVLQRGAAPIGQSTFQDIEARYMVWRNAWRDRIRAAIARKMKAREGQ